METHMNPSDIRKKAEKIVDMFLKPSLKSVERIMDRAALGLVIETSLLEMYSVGKDDGEQAGFERGIEKVADLFKQVVTIDGRPDYAMDSGWDQVSKKILSLLQKDK